MNFLSPGRLLLLLVVAALAGLYVWVQHRRRHAAVRYTNLSLLAEVAPARPGWRRHLPAAAVALALAALVVAIAQPVQQVRVPKEAANVMMVIDVSASMDATDVSPSRLEAAVASAKVFVNDLPPQVRVGLVSFDRIARVVTSPTVDHRLVLDGIDRLILGTGTATGEAVYTRARRPGRGQRHRRRGGHDTGRLGHRAALRRRAHGGQAGAGRGPGSRRPGRADLHHRLRHRRRHGHGPGAPRLRPGRPRHDGGDRRDHERPVLRGGRRPRNSAACTRTSAPASGYETEQRDASGPILTLAVMSLLAASGLALIWNGRIV